MEKSNKVAQGRPLNRIGFTLAEVLITLAIIGVVAALTIPTVINNYQKTQTVTRLKKAYSVLSNTTNLAIADNGPIKNWDVGNQNRDASNAFVKTYLAPYLKVAKICETEIDGACKFTVNGLNKTSTTYGPTFARFYLNDGTFMCLLTFNYSYSGGTLKQADFYVDINGQKPPNTWGKDVFPYVYFIDRPDYPTLNGKFMPFGMQNSRSVSLNDIPNGCNKNASGFYCGSIIVKDGWEIRDDYPW